MTSDYHFLTSDIPQNTNYHLNNSNYLNLKPKKNQYKLQWNAKTHIFLQNFFRMLYVVVNYKSMTSDYHFLTLDIPKNTNQYLKNSNYLNLKPKKNQYKLHWNAKTHIFLQNFFRMLYVVVNYKSMTSDYHFLTSDIPKNTNQYLKNSNYLNLKPKKNQYKLHWNAKTHIFLQTFFRMFICSGELQINDLRLSFSYFKYSQKHKSV